MTVKELIEKLSHEPLDAKVLLVDRVGRLIEARHVSFAWAEEGIANAWIERSMRLSTEVQTAVKIQ